MLLPIRARERLLDLRLAGIAATVAVTGQPRGVRLSGRDLAQDGHPRNSGDVADHVMQLHVHQRQRLLHPLGVHRRILDELVPVANQGAKSRDLRLRSEAPPEQPEGVQLLDPLAAEDVRLPPRNVLHVGGVDQQDLEPTALTEALGVTTDELLGATPLRRKKAAKTDSRLQRRMRQIERMNPREKRQVLQILDALIEREQLRASKG